MLRQDPFITGEYYHIYNRGIDKRAIFKARKDYERFIMLMYLSNGDHPFRLDNIINNQNKKFDEIFNMERGERMISIGAWCLMTNHFHILIKQEAEGGITRFMRKLGVGYSMFFNIKYQRKGALFGGLFKSKLIGVDDNYMRQLFGYVHLNPLEIKFPDWENEIRSPLSDMSIFLKEYPYSSYSDYLGNDRPEKNIINIESFPDYFQEQDSFKDFVENYYTSIESQT